MRRLRNGIVIDMRPLNHMTFSPEQRLVTVGGGTIMDDFTRYVHGLGMEVSKLAVSSTLANTTPDNEIITT